jgi:imidazolonepropionase-like amidohydrolase
MKPAPAFATLLLSLTLGAPALAGQDDAVEGAAGERGVERGLAITAAKILVLPLTGPQAIDQGVLLVRNGRIEAVGRRGELEVPADYEWLDVGERWIAPGMIDLHCHVAAASFFTNDLNDMVYLTNPGLRAFTSVVPGNNSLMTGLAAGITSVLYIPGSGTNIGGQGVLLKTGFQRYERMELRNPGSLKLAQAGNPERWTVGVGRSLMNWNTGNTFRRGLAYARRWEAYEQGRGPRPDKDVQWEVFRDLLAKRTQVSTHTQMYQVVLRTITMVREQFGLDVYIDHGSFDGWRSAAHAWAAMVPAILGPRQISAFMWVEYRRDMWVENDTDGAILGMAAKYQEAGHELVGFNTDSPVIPLEALPLQAAMAVRYGFDTSHAQHLRGLTLVPAIAAGIADRVGSLEPGKDADLIVVNGDPADPRTTVSMTFIEGERLYDIAQEARRW